MIEEFLLRVLGMFRNLREIADSLGRFRSVILDFLRLSQLSTCEIVAESIFQCMGTFLVRLAPRCCACCLQELGKILFGVFLEKTTGLGRRWTFFVVNDSRFPSRVPLVMGYQS